MTNQSSTIFRELLRRVQRGEETRFQYFCDHCGRVTVWWLVAEDARKEFYRCLECGKEKGWTVR